MPKIKQCIGSVKAQIGSGITVEHIVKDGGSTDSSIQYISEAIRNYKNKPIDGYELKFLTGADRGMYDAINIGWSFATGEVLSWLNSDEQYLPGTLSRMKRFFETEESFEYAFGDFIIVSSDGQPISVRRTVPIRRFYLKHDYLYSASCTLFFRRRLYEEGILLFDTIYRLAGDLDLILKLADQKKKSYHLPDLLSLFTVDGKNMSARYEDKMQSEVDHIHNRHGKTNEVMRKWIKLLRTAEKAMSGCYKRNNISYLYATDDRPTYKKIESKNVPFLFSFKRAQRWKG
jgi:glycosyltransferase involved in cell wall biosynthesis